MVRTIPHVRKAYLIILFVSLPLAAQLKFTDPSRLNSQDYVEHQIKDISDRDLLQALRLDQPALKEIDHAFRTSRFEDAFRAWGSYWDLKRQPTYVTQTVGFLLDTDMLKSYDEARAYAQQHRQEMDSTLARARALLRNIIRPWGDVEVNFGTKVDFNREIGRSGKYGFHYWGWSKPLLMAYVATQDQRYLVKFDDLFHQWYSQRNAITRGFPDLDVVYYELGLGVRNRVFIEYYFLPHKDRPWQTHQQMLLAQLALVFPEFKESQEWLAVALQRMKEHLGQDFFEDGGHSERAPRNYTLATYMAFRNLYYLLTAYSAGDDLAAEIRHRMGNTIDWWITMLTPTGEIPAINDSHRGMFPTFILQDGAEFFQKPYIYGVMKNLLGTASKNESFSLPSFTSRHMPASGFTVMRTDWTSSALYMSLNYGKFAGFHTHNDMIDFEIYAYGNALAVDAGLGLTYDDPLYVPWYQSSRAHNMVIVNDRNIERKETEGNNIVWNSGAMLDYFSGEHDGYKNLGVHVQRRVAFVKPSYWVIVDQMDCKKEGDTLSWYFVLPADPQVPSRAGTGMAASTRDFTPGKTEQIQWISFDQISAIGPANQFAILLYPFEGPHVSANISKVADDHFRVSTARGTDDLYFPHAWFSDEEVSTDASFLLLHRENGLIVHFSLVDGTILRVNGRNWWKSKTKRSAEENLPTD
ncbi:MAG: heparinase II/III family protein [Ignavibacteriales bacterium]|nr:heparinase II/III family protein [Ignavibacteriales bacterium]